MSEIKNRKIYCFLGLPGSGKGTQIEILAKRINAQVISIGDEIREEIKEADMKDAFYREMKERYDNGTPQPDEIIIDIIKKRLLSIQDNIIFDNFPFSKRQCQLFFQICRENNVSIPDLIIINITSEESIKRIVYRKVCSDCGHVSLNHNDTLCEKCGGPMITRADDNLETVEERIKNYLPRISEVREAFMGHGIVFDIDGSGTVEEVSELIKNALK